MSSDEGIVHTTSGDTSSPVEAATEVTDVEKLHINAIGVIGLVVGAAGAVAPLAAMFFNVPNIVTQAGAAVPLVFLISAIGMILFAVSIVYFARRISSAGGLYTWVSHALGKGAGFYAGWLMLGGYALFEAASAAAFGGLTDSTLSQFHILSMPGGWVTYALLALIVVSVLTYYDVKWSVRVLAPFLALEVLSLLILDIMTIVRGGAQGQDFVHTFTTAGTALHGVFPGGFLGIGVGMALGVWSFVGGEQGVAFGEEVRFPKRAIPYGLFGVFAGVGLLFVLTTYAAVIGGDGGWQQTAKTLGNIAIAPQPYFDLASRYVGGWLVPILYITISTSTFAAIIAFHNGMTRYLYSMGREAVLPSWFGKTHNRWRSPYTASVVQSLFSILVVLFLAMVFQKTNPDGSTSYAFLFSAGTGYQQTNGIFSYSWLAIIGTIAFIIVYIMVNISAPVYARRHGELNWLAHVIAPVLSSLVLLIPLASFVLPTIPGPIGNFATSTGLFPTPFPLNILPIFPIVWLIIGLIYTTVIRRVDPDRFERLGRIVRGEEGEELVEAAAGAD
ncbi:MAG TPA: APC family permease [Ktedonobacteraceae bacterium]|nr:APC family permease [Ktedonobacteraceae bacterium]